MAGHRAPGPLCYTTSTPIDEGTMCRSTSQSPGPIVVSPIQIGLGAVGQAEDGLEIVLTPIQLAAIFNNETIEESGSLKERFWGAATAVGGALELVGAAALLLTPEPTAVTKIAGATLGAHGVDTTATGVRQIISGRPETSVTSDAAKSAALDFGVDEKNAALIGLTVDIGIPLLLGVVGAARALAIRRGAIRLAAEEAAGGHTIARHVGRTEAQLRARLAAEPRILAATTFQTLSNAEKFVAEGLRANQAAITAWSKTAALGETKAFTHLAGKVVGFGVVRGASGAQQMTRLAVVIRKIQTNGKIYFVLTAYPKP